MFVVFEGIDGSGKTTISNLVAEGLRARALSVTHVREKGKFASRVSEAIRELGRDAKNLELVPEAEFLLYVARDVQLIEQTLRPAVAQSDVVLADRFLGTPEVLGCHGRHLSPAWMAPILEAAARGLEPDLVVLVDVDPALARARRKSTKLASSDARPPARKGLSGAGLQHRLRQGYLECAARAPERWVVVDNTDDLDGVVNRVITLIVEARTSSVPTALRSFARADVAQKPTWHPVSTPAGALDAFLTWIDRRAVHEPRVAAYFASGLWGDGVDERRRALAQRVPEAVLFSLAGLDDDVSWNLRAELRAGSPAWVARSLIGVPPTDERAHALRSGLADQVPAEVAESLEGLDDERSWELRHRLFVQAPDAVMGSLAGLGSERAWSIREQWMLQRGDEISGDHVVAQVAARSIASLEDDRAWTLRKRAFSTAPVAALASLHGASHQRAWEWRQRYLHQAPKVIMATLSGATDPRAWTMRQAVVADCKEALDSMNFLDGPDAWDLRERYADSWPSTAVKTLGPLAHTPRGRALITRQLRAYPTNLSLLKHVAAVALGAHRRIDPQSTEVP